MQAYTGFAQVYDTFMDNVPYDEWADYLALLLQEYGVRDGLILELGCGTGNITRRLSAKGYDMIGIDNSEDMLEIAREAQYDVTDGSFDNEGEWMQQENPKEGNSNNILYLQQDMREFELFGTVAAVVSICDSMNYITSEQDLLTVLQLVNNYLDADGIFIFDMNTEYKYSEILASNTIAENREDCSFIWENYYNKETMENEYDVTIFVKLEENEEDPSTAYFERFQETHYKKAYSIETIINLIKQAGMEFVTVYDACTHNPPTDQSERVYFVAREKHQEKKMYL